MRLLILIALAASLGFVGDDPPLPPTEDCGDQVCLYPSNTAKTPKWKPDGSLSRKARRKEAKNNRKRGDVELRVLVHEGRGSVFVDGRYLPPAGLPVKPGRHELEVRDGSTVITVGVLTVPRRLESLVVEVHSER